MYTLNLRDYVTTKYDNSTLSTRITSEQYDSIEDKEPTIGTA